MTNTVSVPATDFVARQNQVRAEFDALEIDAMLVTHITNIGYLSGFSGTAAQLLLTHDECVLLTDNRYTLQAAAEASTCRVAPVGSSRDYGAVLRHEIAQKSAVRRIGLEGAHTSVLQWRERTEQLAPSSLVETSGVVENLRAIKSVSEVAQIQAAIDLAESAFVGILRRLEPGIVERDVAAYLELGMRLAGADGTSFATIVASGENGAKPHHHTGNRTLRSGDLVTVDWGALLNGYCSDITRTVAIGDPVRLADDKRSAYQAVLEAQDAAIDAVRPGVAARDVDAAARAVLAKYGLADAFTHSTGHGLGRDVHDGIVLSAAQSTELRPGMVITIEPGVYKEGWGGIRIEEDVLVTPTGCKVLTHLSNDLQFFG